MEQVLFGPIEILVLPKRPYSWFSFTNSTELYQKIANDAVTSSTSMAIEDQRTNGPVNDHLISWPSKAQNIQNLQNIW